MSIPTVYRHIRFRSRLEAKWAAFFDASGWHWEYEPLDLNGYVPDFIIVTGEKKTLVEIKPFLTMNPEEWKNAQAKIDSSGWSGSDALILGAAPILSGYGNEWFDHVPCGMYGQWNHEDIPGASLAWDDALWVWCERCGDSISQQMMSWSCAICGQCVGKSFTQAKDDSVTTIQQRWAEACNAVQWKPAEPHA